jgi:hypothetical protein
MEERLALLQMRNDEIWDLLEDPTLPPLDRQMLNEEMLRNVIEIVILEGRRLEDDDESTITCVSSETIGTDEYDREGVIANDDFDLVNEI